MSLPKLAQKTITSLKTTPTTPSSYPLKIRTPPTPIPTKPTINLKILETHLQQQCKSLNHLNQIISQMVLTGFINDTFAASRLLKVSTDLPFTPICYPHRIFTHIEYPNGFIYNTLMRASIRANSPKDAIFMYKLMLRDGICPDHYTYPILVQSCAVRLDEFDGRLIHCHVLKVGFVSDVYVKNTLINFYGVCRRVCDSRKVFDESPVLDLVSWNSMLAGYVLMGDVEESKAFYDRMPERNVIATNSMIVLFGKKGYVLEARSLFDEMGERGLVSWSALISCYEQNGIYEDALQFFKQMVGLGVPVDEVVVVSALSAGAQFVVVEMGKLIHGLVLKIGIEFYINVQNALIHLYSSCREMETAEKLFYESNCLDFISWNSMISCYIKSGEIDKAKTLFDSMYEKDIVTWSAMISGYAQHDKFTETLELFQEMQLDGIKPDETILVSVLSACTHSAAFDQGRWVHAYIKRNNLKINVILGTTLIDMYMKFGCIENALDIFNEMEEKGVSSWNALILGLAMNGLVEKSLNLFSKMKEHSVAPNEITFMAVLGACRHMGMVDEGRRHFNSMTEMHNVAPNVKHYGCMVDLLGRAGLLNEAEELIYSMPMEPDVSTWGALLGACKKYNNNEIGERVGKKLIELQPEHDGFHVLLSNIYASKGNWEDVIEVRETMVQNRVVKMPGCSMIEVNGIVHEFLAGDKIHPQIIAIEDKLDEIANRIRKIGYAPDTHEVPLEIDEEEKETTLLRHSEKLAIAFGLMTTDQQVPIRIMKNLRICNDCHTAAKLISSAFGREIVVRDKHRFHHFKQGSCSCNDYW